ARAPGTAGDAPTGHPSSGTPRIRRAFAARGRGRRPRNACTCRCSCSFQSCPNYARVALERRTIPIPEVGGGIVHALQELEKRGVRIRRRANVGVGKHVL